MKYAVLMVGLLVLTAVAAQAIEGGADAPDPNRFAAAIDGFAAADKAAPPDAGQVLFTGSSSVRMWKLDESFPELDALNRGFGGSTLPDVLHYFDRVVTPYAPRVVVLYCGDNDITLGRSAKQVLDDFKTFVVRVHEKTGEKTPIVFIAIKPSRARWHLWPKMREANKLIAAYAAEQKHVTFADVAAPMLAAAAPDDPPPADLFIKDGLHLSAKGYALWAKVLTPLVSERRETPNGDGD